MNSDRPTGGEPHRTVSIMCLHRGAGGPPVEIVSREATTGRNRRDLAAALDRYPDLPGDADAPAEIARAFAKVLEESSREQRQANRGHWVKDGEVIAPTVGDVLAGAKVAHQLRCPVCGTTERISEDDLMRAVAHAAALDTPDAPILPLGGIKRYLRLIE